MTNTENNLVNNIKNVRSLAHYQLKPAQNLMVKLEDSA